jgi:hypothetical protein
MRPLVGVLAIALAACHGHASEEDCHAMTEHYLDLALKETPGSSTLSAPQAAAVRDVQRGLKRAVPAYRRVEDHCALLTRAQVSCAADATSTAAWESCVQSSDAQWYDR